MKVTSIVLLICCLLAVAYAATATSDLKAEESSQVLTRNKRGLLLAKAALIGGGALLAKKALIVGGAGLAGAALYKAKSHYGGGYGYGGYGSRGGYGYGGYGSHGGYYKTYYRPVYYSSGWNNGW